MGAFLPSTLACYNTDGEKVDEIALRAPATKFNFKSLAMFHALELPSAFNSVRINRNLKWNTVTVEENPRASAGKIVRDVDLPLADRITVFMTLAGFLKDEIEVVEIHAEWDEKSKGWEE